MNFYSCVAGSLVIRQILVRENAALEAQDMLVLKGAKKQRVEEYARCEYHTEREAWRLTRHVIVEGISFEEAVERKKGFRYLF